MRTDATELMGARIVHTFHLPPDIERVPRVFDVVFDGTAPALVIEVRPLHTRDSTCTVRHDGHLVTVRPLAHHEYLALAEQGAPEFVARFGT